MSSQPPVRVESAEEQYAYMLSQFGDPATWRVISQGFEVDTEGRDVERVEVQVNGADIVEVRFRAVREDAIFGDTQAPEEEGSTGFLDAVMETAFQFSAQTPPHHPGSLARFPVPSAGYANALAVAMPVIALDQGMRGLYSPPRVVVVDFASGKGKGVGEFPGFDPESWPPPRLGDWPPTLLKTMHQQQIQGSIMRFSALWKRILDAWFSKDIEGSPELTAEINEALTLRERLELPAMIPIYDRLNPVFARWLSRHSTAEGTPPGA